MVETVAFEYKIGGKIYILNPAVVDSIKSLTNVSNAFNAWKSVVDDNPAINTSALFEKFSFFFATILRGKKDLSAEKDLNRLVMEFRASIDSDGLPLLIQALNDFLDKFSLLNDSIGQHHSKKKKFRLPFLFRR